MAPTPTTTVYIAGTGTTKAVKITSGNAVGGAALGTITFTAANNHSAGFTIQTASGGINARYYWLLLAEGHLNRQRFGAMLGRIRLLPVPTG